ncbi:MAG: hypothetical protein RLY71_2274 [Pseudomonadota bacterium]
MSPLDQSPHWRELVEASWPAVTAGDLLRGNKDVWSTEGLKPPSDAEAIALAAMGRVVRYGGSIALQLPVGRETVPPRLAYYLHRLRMDAAQGLVRSRWFNRVTLAPRTDLVIFGRPRSMLRDFATSSMMRPLVVDNVKRIEPELYQRTLLANGHGDLLGTLQKLEQQSNPFAIVVLTTAQGCAGNAYGLLRELPTFFPGVPIVALGYTGEVVDPQPAMHAWTTRLGDLTPAGRQAVQPQASKVEVVAARDAVMDGFVKRLGFLVWNLKQLMERVGTLPQELAAFLSIARSFHGLNVPLPVHEHAMLQHLRGGQFPVRLIEGWLQIAQRAPARRGDIESVKEEVVALIQHGLKQMHDARPGRAELIVQLASQALGRRQRMVIMVGSRRDAFILQEWLERSLGHESVERVSVHHMDGAMATPAHRSDLVLYAAPLFPSRIHWLGLPAECKRVLCHPFEKDRVSGQIERWWRAFASPSARHGDKCRLWSLDWPAADHLRDELVDEPSPAAATTWTEFPIDGVYPQPLRVAEVEAGRRYDDWLDVLLTDPAHAAHEDEPPSAVFKDVVVLYLDEGEPLRWAAHRPILRLDGDALAACLARDLAPGNDLVVMTHGEERVATQREIFDMFVQDYHGLMQTVRVAEKWQQYVDAAVAKAGSIAALTRYLVSRKLSRTQGAVQQWVAGKVIGPADAQAVELLAEYVDTPGAAKMAAMVFNAIEVVRREHRFIGSDLRKAIAASRNRGVSAVKIGSRSFSREVFDDMVQVVRVVKVDRPGLAHERSVKTLQTMAASFQERYPQCIEFTPACQRSMDSSPYEDLQAFEKVLQVLVDGFHPMYSTSSLSLRDVEEQLAVIPASYAGNTSALTKGKYDGDYFRTYRGKRVDISRHIKLGRVHDPRYTLRLHFHWDDEVSKIVVHHAGQHLPTIRE